MHRLDYQEMWVWLQKLTDELVDEEADGDDVEDEQVKDVLPVLLQKVGPDGDVIKHSFVFVRLEAFLWNATNLTYKCYKKRCGSRHYQ